MDILVFCHDDVQCKRVATDMATNDYPAFKVFDLKDNRLRTFKTENCLPVETTPTEPDDAYKLEAQSLSQKFNDGSTRAVCNRVNHVLEQALQLTPDTMLDAIKAWDTLGALDRGIFLRWTRNTAYIWLDFKEDPSWTKHTIDHDPLHPDNLSNYVVTSWMHKHGEYQG
jgi:hypothetical protein